MNRQHAFALLWLMVTIILAVIAFITAAYVAFSRAPEGSVAVHQTASVQTEKAPDQEALALPSDTEEPSPTPEPTPSPTPEPAPVILAETEDMGQEYLDKMIFIGDSTTYGLGAFKVVPFTQLWVPSSGTLTLSAQSYTEIDYYNEDGSKQSMLLKDAAALAQPEYIIITLGLNGISFMDEDEFKTEYIDLIHAIQEVSPDTKIICHSIYPVIDSIVSSDIGNDRILRANGWILDIATETGTRYLNTHDALMDSTGNLKAEYNAGMGDGIHLNFDGLTAVTESVRTHGYR